MSGSREYPKRVVDKSSPRPFLQFTGDGGVLIHPPSFVWRVYTPEEVGISREAYHACIEALDKYEARTMWNAQPSASRKGAFSIIRHLQQKGDMDAYDLAERIKKLLGMPVDNTGRGSRVTTGEPGSMYFFTPIKDKEYGRRLHLFDVAISHTLAASRRRVKRDMADMYFIHHNLCPIWLCAWACPGKSRDATPTRILNDIIRNNRFAPDYIEEQENYMFDVMRPMDTVEQAIEIAQESLKIVEKLDASPAIPGRVLLGENGLPVTDPEWYTNPPVTLRESYIEPAIGGSWPSTSDADSLLVQGIVNRYGQDGLKALEEYYSSFPLYIGSADPEVS